MARASFQITLKSNGRVVSGELLATSYREHYGADADGNRGEWRTFYEPYDCENLEAEDGEPLSKDEEREAYELACDAVEDWDL
jgi:hypothetical protein